MVGDESSDGSSPHTRGARDLRRSRALLPGIIPAYAGSTRRRLRGTACAWDHPRIRGEHSAYSVDHVALMGSSPHTRGAPRSARGRGHHERIIPAYAGSTSCTPYCSDCGTDHPRIRGEHMSIGFRPDPDGGSSPHTRGALDRQTRRREKASDHPRIRGEHSPASSPPSLDSGSSPHTRGAPYPVSGRPMTQRIIPAYAGSTVAAGAPFGISRDHPRIRGEHDDSDQYVIDGLGSSPHTRGARHPGARVVVVERIIPAYAGSTAAVLPAGGRVGDHPRIRGEHASCCALMLFAVGSSPHTRGAPQLRRRPPRRPGIIPAYAGSTSDVVPVVA
mgnify:CR=1 FL=1